MFEDYRDKEYIIYLVMYTTERQRRALSSVKILNMWEAGIEYKCPVTKELQFVPYANIAIIKEYNENKDT
jgi:hypothetical protein